MKANLPASLDHISEDELLNLRICDLPLTLGGTWLEECIQQLYQELAEKGLTFKPVCYLADEWLTPKDEPVIGIPFYLAHPALIRLERKMMLEAEGDSRENCLKLLRHETGHAVSYAYNLYQKKEWQAVFGPASKEYGETYRFRPYSKNYVRHLDGFYAQFHPEEDFVETFAVWLTPGSQWQKVYAGWPAFQKLRYVDELLNSIKGREPDVPKGTKYWHYKNLKVTLRNFYKKKRRFWAEEFPDFHDANLRKIFSAATDGKPESGAVAAHGILKKYEKFLEDEIAVWTGERKYVVSNLLKAVKQRCRELKLLSSQPETLVISRVSSYITTLVMNYIYTGWYRGDKKKGKKG